MRKWYKKRGGYLPRIPWGKRPRWYTNIRRRPAPYFRPPSYTNYVTSDFYKNFLEKLDDDKLKDFKKESIKRKHRVKRVTTIPLSSDQKKLLETTKPKSDKRKKVKPYKDTKSFKKKRLPKKQEPQSNKTDIKTGDMPRRKRRMTKRMYRKNRPTTRLKRWLRPLRSRKGKLTRKVTRYGTGSTFSSFSSSQRRKKNKYTYVLSTFPWQKRLEVKTAKEVGNYNKQKVRGALTTLDMLDFNALETNLPASDRTGSILIEKVESVTQMSNMSKASVIIDIIDYHYRKDANLSFASLWDNGMGQVHVSAQKEDIGITPFMSPSLTAAVKIDKIHRIELGQGGSHMHRSVRRYNRIFNLEDLDSSSNNYMRGWTAGTAYIMRGEPVNGKDTNSSLVNTALTAVDFVTTETTTYKYAQPIRKVLDYVNTVTQLTTAQMMDEGDGAIEDVQYA